VAEPTAKRWHRPHSRFYYLRAGPYELRVWPSMLERRRRRAWVWVVEYDGREFGRGTCPRLCDAKAMAILVADETFRRGDRG
jgi:hypothetical protein